MREDRQNKIYYKGNPYTSNNYVPSSAQKNRIKPHYLVQLPQGQDYFGVSRRKQYSYLHHQSQIKDTGIFQNQQSTYNHGTYQVSDIDGATPNSLLSQAIKNRMKFSSNQNKRYLQPSSREYKAQNLTQNSAKIHTQQVGQYQLQKKQLEHRSKAQNFHLVQNNRVQTEPTYLQPFERGKLSYENNNHQYQYKNSTLQNPQRKQIQQRIQANDHMNKLQRQLFLEQQNRLKDQGRQKKQTSQSSNNINYKFSYLPRNPQTDLTEANLKKQPISNQLGNSKLRSVEDIRNMVHGDHHRLLYPSRNIRKFNPTYLSTENFADTSGKYREFYLSNIH